MTDKILYRISFHSQGKIYEIYARKISDAGLLGFVQVEQLVFGERGGLVVDPSAERLRDEFAGVSKTYIPIQTIIRIDQVDRQGVSKIRDASGANVTPFPMPGFPSPSGNNKN